VTECSLKAKARGLIDTHVHFFDQTPKGPALTWRWLGDDFVHPVLGDIEGIKGRRFAPRELSAEARLTHLKGVIHVQSARDSADPVHETEWLEQVASTSEVPILGIVAEAFLQHADAARMLERHATSSLVRGIRDFGHGDYLADPAFAKGYALLARYDWCFDWNAHWTQFEHAGRLARQHPDIRLIVEHCGAPPLSNPELMATWLAGLRRLAAAPNVAIKLSGWGMSDAAWTPRTIRPMLLNCLETFGTERSFFGSNWPFGRLSASYPETVSGVVQLFDELSLHEQVDLIHRSARRWYRLEEQEREDG
jgi:predicted TIM-barrel fold metal-dependent hydrolase